MSAKHVRISMVVLCLLVATASFAASLWPTEPAFLAAAPGASCPAVGAIGGGNCNDDSDCGPGQFCYHDPIALVPYCAPRSGQTIEFQNP